MDRWFEWVRRSFCALLSVSMLTSESSLPPPPFTLYTSLYSRALRENRIRRSSGRFSAEMDAKTRLRWLLRISVSLPTLSLRYMRFWMRSKATSRQTCDASSRLRPAAAASSRSFGALWPCRFGLSLRFLEKAFIERRLFDLDFPQWALEICRFDAASRSASSVASSVDAAAARPRASDDEELRRRAGARPSGTAPCRGFQLRPLASGASASGAGASASADGASAARAGAGSEPDATLRFDFRPSHASRTALMPSSAVWTSWYKPRCSFTRRQGRPLSSQMSVRCT
mmetsp:Transcript_1807/g.5402  ORF Transcript_1807/g.5402 Transcript_1807/m.5402 type:complete len:286 (-) Transcript_1807:192-1049(-)